MIIKHVFRIFSVISGHKIQEKTIFVYVYLYSCHHKTNSYIETEFLNFVTNWGLKLIVMIKIT